MLHFPEIRKFMEALKFQYKIPGSAKPSLWHHKPEEGVPSPISPILNISFIGNKALET